MTEADDAHISVRFKHGIHTIYLFVDTLAPLSAVSNELAEILRERYPGGLTTSTTPPKTTPIPSEPAFAYGMLSVPNDPSRGWKRLKVGDGEATTPNKCGLKQNSIVAFAFVEDDEDEAVFEVEWPREDEEMYEEAGP